MSYKNLAQVGEQWPMIGRSDLYYGGSSYENTQGLGVHLSLPDQIPPLAWPQVPELNLVEGALMAVPITLLYDHGQTIHHSQLLHQRTPPAYIAVNPEVAQRLKYSQSGMGPIFSRWFACRSNITQFGTGSLGGGTRAAQPGAAD